MEYIEIFGGRTLTGRVEIQGSKNASLPITAAALVNGNKTVLHNCPRISDIYNMINIMQSIGCIIEWKDNTLLIDSKNAFYNQISNMEALAMRSSIVLAGAMLTRFGKAKVPYPGGCVIGKRPIDLHLYAFERLGATVSEEDGMISIFGDKLYGNIIEFPIKSVGATENAILAAISAVGETSIINAALEPEITALCEFLNKMGADVKGAGSDCIIINGGKNFNKAEYCVIPDRIVAGTYVFAAAATRGSIILDNFPFEHLSCVLNVFEQLGGKYKKTNNSLILDAESADNNIVWIETKSYPGFPTDLQSQLMAVLINAKGDSCIRENIFESRFNISQELKKFGAKVYIDANDAYITKSKGLYPAEVSAMDLRGGAALVIAGLAVRGVSYVKGCSYIERGYEDICRDLRKLGAGIRKIKV